MKDIKSIEEFLRIADEAKAEKEKAIHTQSYEKAAKWRGLEREALCEIYNLDPTHPRALSDGGIRRQIAHQSVLTTVRATTTSDKYWECGRCEINSHMEDNPDRMCPCPRGSCEAEHVGTVVTSVTITKEPKVKL